MISLRRLILSLLYVAVAIPAFSQSQLVFTPIDNKNGLSENRIRNILQLSDGRMVFTTEGVTNIYDGTSFRHIHLKGANLLPLTGYNGFHHGYVDRDYMWMKVFGKLMLLDVRQERFVSRPDSVLATMNIRESLADFFMDEDKNGWFRTTSDKLIYRNSRTNAARLFCRQVSWVNGTKEELYDLAVLNGQLFLFYRHGQVVCYDLHSAKRLYQTSAFEGNDRSRYDRTLMLVQSGDAIYQLRNGAGGILQKYDVKKRTWSVILKADYNFNTLSRDKSGNLWIGSRKGLWCIDPTLQNKTLIPDFRQADGSIIQTEASTQYQDTQGGLWIGTYNRGLLYYHPDRFKFRNVGLSAFGAEVKGLDVTCFAETDKGGTIVGTSRGLFRFDKISGLHTAISGIAPDVFCISLTRDRQSRIWVCMDNQGLYCIQKEVIRYLKTTVTVRQICEIADGRLLAATNSGLGWLNPETGALQLIPLPESLRNQNYINQIVALDSEHVLIRGNAGLLIYNLRSRQFSMQLKELLKNGNQQFNCCYRDHRGLVWIGSQDGLNIWHPETNGLHTLYADNGLVNNSIKGLQEERRGRMWVSTSGGISCINVSGRTDNLNFTYSNFNHYDGTLANEFTDGAAFLDSRGLLLLGGVNGFNSIDLTKPLAMVTRLPKPLFSNLFLFGEKVRPGNSYDGNEILNRSITSTDRIELYHNQNFISVTFSALNYINPTQTYFRYRLEGVDDNWRKTQAQDGTGIATYTNLSPGTYRLQVKSANNSQIWSTDYSEIVIEVKAPFWKTPLAYTIYLIMFVLSSYFSLKYYQRQAHRRMARRNEEKLNRMKFNFFTNVSHEFRTPLTLIITPLESWLKEVKGTTAEARVRSIYRHARDLQNLVNQLLDFRRLEVKGEKLVLTFGNIVDFVKQFEELFARLAQEKQITFDIHSTQDERFCYFDLEKLYRILNNLLSNAFKFTPENGRISVHLTRIEEDGKEYLQIRVSDTGKGIAADELPNIFNRFYQASGTEQGSGIGLHLVKEYAELHSGQISVESEMEKGTAFTLKLPLYLTPAQEDERPFNPDESENEDEVILPVTAGDKRYKLLVVEDNTELRRFLVEELSKSYGVMEAPDGIGGRTLARDTLPDLVISDVMMPGMNGLELCRHLKTDLQTSHIPVILLTARTSDEHKLEGYRVGADEYLPKPFNLDILHLRISKLIAQQQQRQKEFTRKIEVNPKEITITSLDEQLVAKALACIEKNMDNPDFSVLQFSEEMAMDRTVLYKKLQSITGLAPSEFIRSIRLKRAAQLLAQGLTVGEVSDRVGFNTQRYFSSYFKEMFGVTPSQYIQELRKK